MLRLGAMETILKLTAKAGIVTAWNKSEMELRLLGDRRIIFRSADNPDRLRGANAGWLWLDEVAMMNADIWPLSIATLRESPGRAWMTTTPRGKDWVYQLFDGDHRDYATIRSKTTDNMFLDDTFVATLKQSMTSEMYRQEVDGEFTDPVGPRASSGSDIGTWPHRFARVPTIPRACGSVCIMASYTSPTVFASRLNGQMCGAS